MVVNKFKAPIEKFNTNEDFQNWCKEKVENEIISKKEEIVKSCDIQAKLQKDKILSDWIDYATVENTAYSPAVQLLILSSIISDLSYETNHLPPSLDKRTLADTLVEISENSKNDKNYNCNFNKLYRNKLFTGVVSENNSIDNTLTGWITIPSKTNDPDNFYDSWCTKTYNARPYLAEGDFHIYLDNGKPKLGVRFVEDEIAEIQGEKNNSKIPINYLDTVKSYIQENNYKYSNKVTKEFRQAQNAKEEIYRIELNLKEKGVDFKTCSTKQLFDALEIGYEEDNNGKLILNKYRQPSDDYDFNDLGINEDKLFKDIIAIKGNADFRGSKVASLANLQSIGGEANFYGSKITSLGNLKYIGGKTYGI